MSSYHKIADVYADTIKNEGFYNPEKQQSTVISYKAKKSEPEHDENIINTGVTNNTKGIKLALLIGIDLYSDKSIPTLETPISDVKDIGMILSDYGYNVRIITNATKYAIVNEIYHLGDTLTFNDHVIIYFAGHGYMMEGSHEGFWIPSDANLSSANTWISNNDIMKFMSRIRASQILLISDSCYAGSMIRGHKIIEKSKLVDEKYAYKLRSVVSMTSGGEEPVADTGVENHSVFAYYIINSLKNTVNEIKIGLDLFNSIREQVAFEVPQTPEYGGIDLAGHDDGTDFHFNYFSSTSPEAYELDHISTKDDIKKAVWDIVLGNKQALRYLLELAYDGNIDAQAALAQSYRNLPRSTENIIRAIAWTNIVNNNYLIKANGDAEKLEKSVEITDIDEDMQVKADVFRDSLYMRYPRINASSSSYSKTIHNSP